MSNNGQSLQSGTPHPQSQQANEIQNAPIDAAHASVLPQADSPTHVEHGPTPAHVTGSPSTTAGSRTALAKLIEVNHPILFPWQMDCDEWLMQVMNVFDAIGSDDERAEFTKEFMAEIERKRFVLLQSEQQCDATLQQLEADIAHNQRVRQLLEELAATQITAIDSCKLIVERSRYSPIRRSPSHASNEPGSIQAGGQSTKPAPLHYSSGSRLMSDIPPVPDFDCTDEDLAMEEDPQAPPNAEDFSYFGTIYTLEHWI